MKRLALASATSLILAASGLVQPAIAADRPLPMAEAKTQENRDVSFVVALPAHRDTLIVPLASREELDPHTNALREGEQASLERALSSANFGFDVGETLTLRGVGDWNRILLVGLGSDGTAADHQKSGAVAARTTLDDPGQVTVMADALAPSEAAAFATGLGIGEYRSDLYSTPSEQSGSRGPFSIVTRANDDAQTLFDQRGRTLIRAMAWARDISNEPGNTVYPETFVARTREAFAGIRDVEIEVLDEAAMNRLGMGAILGVGRGSERPPRMLIVRYRGAGAASARPIALVGKGITFDTGGISIKPSQNMENMRMDMSGAASVMGATLSLAQSEAPVHVVAVAALAENMPDGRAIRPGDVLKAMNGKTIQVINTDAEGRLVLADALSWVEQNLQPAAVVDLATLTGAVGRALSNDYAGLFSRHEPLAAQLQNAGETVGEPLWRLPLHDSYAEDMSSTVADIRNTSTGSGAGAGTAAHFLGEFISRDIPWAHLDIANMAWSGANEWKPDGSAAFGVRLLDHFVRNFESVESAD